MKLRCREDTERGARKPEQAEPLAEGISGRRAGRPWRSMSDADLESYAMKFIGENGIRTRIGLWKRDCGLYSILRKRGMLDAVGLKRKHRDWSSIADDKLLMYAKRFITKMGISSREDLRRVDSSLHWILAERGLLDSAGFAANPRRWKAMEDKELVAIAREFISGKGIASRKGLEQSDDGLYQALRKRSLLNSVGLPNLHGDHRKWSSLGKEELMEYARRCVSEAGMRGKKELEKADMGLYSVLWRRGLLDRVGLEDLRGRANHWERMRDAEIVSFGRRFLEANGLKLRSELMGEYRGLYEALRKRKLLDAVFSDTESSAQKEAVRGVVEALESFGDEA